MARSLPKVCPFLVTVDLKLKWPELPRGPNYPALPYAITESRVLPEKFMKSMSRAKGYHGTDGIGGRKQEDG